MFDFQYNHDNYDISVYKDNKYSKRIIEVVPGANIKELKTAKNEKQITSEKIQLKKQVTVNFKGLEWYVLKTNAEKTTLLLKDVLSSEIIKKIATKQYSCFDNNVYHFRSKVLFVWSRSYIKTIILPRFKELLEIEGEVDLLNKFQCVKLPKEVLKTSCDYWLKSSTVSHPTYSPTVHFISSEGEIKTSLVNGMHAVRPILTISTKLLNDLLNKNQNISRKEG